MVEGIAVTIFLAFGVYILMSVVEWGADSHYARSNLRAMKRLERDRLKAKIEEIEKERSE